MTKRTGRLTLFNTKMAELGWTPKQMLVGSRLGTSITLHWIRTPTLNEQDVKYFQEQCVEGAEFMYATMESDFERLNLRYHPDPFTNSRFRATASSDLERIAHAQVQQRIMAAIKADYQQVYDKTVSLWTELMTVELE